MMKLRFNAFTVGLLPKLRRVREGQWYNSFLKDNKLFFYSKFG